MMLLKLETRALFRLQHIYPLDGIPESALFLEVQAVTLFIAFDQDAEETEEELHVLLGRSERERIDREVARILAHVQVGTPEDRCQRLETAANIEDVGLRCVFLCILQHEVAEIALARTRHPEDERVGYLAVVQVQEIWCAVVCLKHGKIFGPKMRVPRFPRQDSE